MVAARHSLKAVAGGAIAADAGDTEARRASGPSGEGLDQCGPLGSTSNCKVNYVNEVVVFHCLRDGAVGRHIGELEVGADVEELVSGGDGE